MLRHKMAAYSMDKLTPAVVANYRDERLKTVAPGWDFLSVKHLFHYTGKSVTYWNTNRIP